MPAEVADSRTAGSVPSPARHDRISVVLNTLDEERHLPYALRSVCPWADEIVVVDMESRDRTAKIAHAHGARVIRHERLGWVEPARALAIGAATHPWILLLDADELVPIGLSHRLRDIASREDVDVLRIPRLNYILGSPLHHSGWNPRRELHARFFRRGAVEMPTRLHEPFRPVAGARVRELSYAPGEALVHFNYTDVDAFVAKLAHYTTLEADLARGRGERSSRARALYGALREWAVRYLWHGGYRDGWRGFYLSLAMAFYRVAIEAKLASREQIGSSDDVARVYAREAERLLEPYVGTSSTPGPEPSREDEPTPGGAPI